MTQRYIHFSLLLLLFSFLTLPVNAQNSEETIQQLIDKVSIENLTEHIKILEDAGGTRSRIAYTAGVDSAAAYVKRMFDGIPGLSSVEIDTFYISSAATSLKSKPQFNVVATILGETHPEEMYVLGAHLDATANNERSWKISEGANWQTIEAPGADDNATGLAAIIEIAKILGDPDNNFKSDYTIKLVAFGAEENGAGRSIHYSGNHHGSEHFAEKASAASEEILGMISVDMIGFNNFYDYASIVKVQDGIMEQSVALGKRLISANEGFSIGLETNEPPFASGTYSDHQSFSDNGFPSVLVIENAPWSTNWYYKQENPVYHTSDDTFDYLNMEQVKKITQMSLATVASFGGVTTGIEEMESDLATDIQLSQNYPNPFNPSTVISFRLASNSNVNLDVFDLMGRKVATLIDGERKPIGSHQVIFDAQNLASGIYIYRLQTDQALLSKQMILMK